MMLYFFQWYLFLGNRPPKIHTQPSNKDIYFKPGETIEIDCVADGTPIPKYVLDHQPVVILL